ncbi:MAG TPA: arginine deiminase family protein [Acidimicrobiia bacterium]|nr:arginine deiminase family protein [Acidimicrobiia bacterium]
MIVRPVAVVRPVPDSFVSCVTSRPARPPLDPVLARQQHAGYAAALRAGGFAVHQAPMSEEHPDSPFIEDTAVVVGTRALLTRPGHPSRRGEVAAVGETLARWVEVSRVDEGTIDGGDVLQLGDRVLVGASTRTDGAGIAALTRFCAPTPVIAVPVGATLHLKSGVSALDPETVLWHRAACDRAALDGIRVIEVPGDDPEAANVVRLADGSILVGSHQTMTADLASGRGFEVRTVDVGEFARADGGLTCLSLRLRAVTTVSSGP